MAKKLQFGSKARAKLLSGINQLANSVKATLGPNGRYAILEKSYGLPLITNDGVTVAKEIELKDPVENMGAKLLHEVSSKTNDAVGDGTTTAIVLTQAIVNEGLKQVEAGANPILLKEGIEKASKLIAKEIINQATPIDNDEKIRAIAEISSKDKEIGKLIQNAIKKVGKTGMVTIEESNSFETYVDLVRGMHFDQGFASPYMAGSNKTSATLTRPLVLVTEKKINSIQDLLPLLEQIVKGGKALLIIANDFDEDVIAALVINKLQGTLKNVIAVKAPFGGDRSALLEDIAIYTGATFISENSELHLKDVVLSDLGQAEKIEITKDRTIIMSGKGDVHQVEQRISELSERVEETESKMDKEVFQKRIAKLSGGVGVIKVGAATEIEMNEKKHKIEDALNSTYAALEDGIVPGGGITFLRAMKAVEPNESDLVDVKIGFEIMRNALSMPLKIIAENSGQNGEVVLNKVVEDDLKYGYDALTGKYVDVIKEGIIDPAKTARSAILNASSVAALVLTTEVAVSSEEETEEK